MDVQLNKENLEIRKEFFMVPMQTLNIKTTEFSVVYSKATGGWGGGHELWTNPSIMAYKTVFVHT